MIEVNMFIKSLLVKKGWTLSKFADEINKVKKKAGISSRTRRQNISNFLNKTDDKHRLRPKQLVIWEKALDLKEDTLVGMVAPPRDKKAVVEFEKIKELIRREE